MILFILKYDDIIIAYNIIVVKYVEDHQKQLLKQISKIKSIPPYKSQNTSSTFQTMPSTENFDCVEVNKNTKR